MTFGFATRIAAVLAVILSIGLGITGLLSVQMFGRTLGEFLSTRFEFVVRDVKQRIETQMDLGLELSDIENIPEIMGTYLRDDPQIYTIEVFDQIGTVLYSTDTSFEGDLVTEEWIQAWRETGDDGVWTQFQRDAGVVGVTLRNSFDQDVGSLALRYSRDFLDESVSEHGSRLFLIGTVNVAVITLLALLGSIAILRRPLLDLKQLHEAIGKVMKRGDGMPVEAGLKTPSPDFDAFASEVCIAQDMIADATGEIRKIDEDQTS